MKPIKHIKNKINEAILKIMEESVDIKLYLLQEKGPLSFMFQEESNQKKINVSIGSRIECSCSEGNKREHCVHTVYVLNRFFKLKFNDPLILQTNYSDAELTKLVEIRTKKNEKAEIKTQKSTLKMDVPELCENEGNRMHLSDDTSCPICQEDMYTFEKLLYCSKSCGHNFHNHCLKVWIDHKKAGNNNNYESLTNTVKLTCPMCRGELDEELIAKFQSLHGNSAATYNPKQGKPHKNIGCKVCSRTNIKAERVHCLNCENFDICVECVTKHESSHFLICKKFPEDSWNPCEIVNGNIVIKSLKLVNFLINCLEYTEIDSIEENEREHQENLDNSIEVNASSPPIEKKCALCNGNKKSKLDIMRYKKLPCSHLVHYKCSERLFNNQDNSENFNKCPIDKMLIFKGLTSIKVRNIEAKKSETQTKKNPNQEKNSSNLINELCIMSVGVNNNFPPSNNKSKKTYPNTSASSRKSLNSKNMNSNNNFVTGTVGGLGLALEIQRVDFKENVDVKTFETIEKEKLRKKPSIPQRRNLSVKTITKSRKLPTLTDRRNVEEEKFESLINDLEPNKNNNHRNIKVIDLKIKNFKLSPLLYDK